jgi:hypothetical protein
MFGEATTLRLTVLVAMGCIGCNDEARSTRWARFGQTADQHTTINEESAFTRSLRNGSNATASAAPGTPTDGEASFARALSNPPSTLIQTAPSATTNEAATRDKVRVVLEMPAWLERALTDAPTNKRLGARPPCRNAQVVGPVEALAAPGRAILRCCEPSPKAPSGVQEFKARGASDQRCTYAISTAAGWARVKTRAQLAAALGPARTPSEAFGRVALVDGRLVLPLDGYRPLAMPRRHSEGSNQIVVLNSGVNATGRTFEVSIASSSQWRDRHALSRLTYEVNNTGLVTLTSSVLEVADGVIDE